MYSLRITHIQHMSDLKPNIVIDETFDTVKLLRGVLTHFMPLISFENIRKPEVSKGISGVKWIK